MAGGDRMRATRELLAAALVLALGGCAALEEPEVRFEGVRVASLGLDGGTLYVGVHVINPNGFGLEAGRLEYDLDIREQPGAEWVDLAAGTWEEEIQVAGRDSTRVDIPIEFTYRQLGPAIRSVLSRGSMTLRVAGSVQVTEPIRRRVPFRREATLDVAGGRDH